MEAWQKYIIITFQRRRYSKKSPGISKFHLGLKFVCRNMMSPSGEYCVIVLPKKAGLQNNFMHSVLLMLSTGS